MDIENTILKFALQNAIRYNGKANPGNVIPKILGEDPTLKSSIKEIALKVNRIVAEVNALALEVQILKLQELAPEMLEKKEHVEKDIFGVLGIKEGQKVRSAFPPGPEKYPHIGHAKACYLNYLLAKKFNGEFILRFEDTNPTLVKSIFYDMLVENLSWLGMKWDHLIYASDYMDLYYKYCEKVLTDEKAYVCFCDEEAIKKSRADGVPCKCRDHSVSDNLKYWKEMKNYPEGKAIVRLKIDLLAQNSTMRDPTIFRVITEPHARHGTKYRIWPNYDFQNAIMDGHFEITNRVRSKEFEMRSELQRYIQGILGLKITQTYEFGRFNMEGVVSSGRVIREFIQKGEYMGWDDPRLTTLVALRRRGFLPQAILEFVLGTGMTKNEGTVTWDDLILHNKKILDKDAKRLFFVHDYKKVKIKDTPKMQVEIDNHPTNTSLGKRKMEIDGEFYLLQSDINELKDGELYRLIDCMNFRHEKGELVFDSTDFERFHNKGKKIMHFIPANSENVHVEIMMNDTSIIKGLAEENVKKLQIGEVIQFQRFGFCRLDEIKGNVYKFWFTHE